MLKCLLIKQAIDVLGIYLTDSPVAPLTKEFVERESPLCTGIGFYETPRATGIEMAVYFESVPTEILLDGSLEKKFKQTLQRISKEGFDMERMRLVLKRERLKVCGHTG
jgi:Zn-dependent M16 (insulinase) family peptidase